MLKVNLATIKNLIKVQKNTNYIGYRPENPYLPTKKDLLVLIPFVEQDFMTTINKLALLIKMN